MVNYKLLDSLGKPKLEMYTSINKKQVDGNFLDKLRLGMCTSKLTENKWKFYFLNESELKMYIS
uniref:Uncharacterized protein n=1 Tax=Rhizophagus irregularis (strain DAOM 181602 / DAOM 197198 / MUCL 43194) TaxID=747089 RepID=U9UUZ6_RHIID